MICHPMKNFIYVTSNGMGICIIKQNTSKMCSAFLYEYVRVSDNGCTCINIPTADMFSQCFLYLSCIEFSYSFA